MKRLLPLLVVALLQAGDYASTQLAFAHGAVELNPIVHRMGVGAGKLAALCIVGLLIFRGPRSSWLAWVACGLYSAFILSNVLLVVAR